MQSFTSGVKGQSRLLQSRDGTNMAFGPKGVPAVRRWGMKRIVRTSSDASVRLEESPGEAGGTMDEEDNGAGAVEEKPKGGLKRYTV